MESETNSNIKTVVEGEASESDEDIEPEAATQSKEDKTTTSPIAAGVIVSGEASESEDENDTHDVLPPLNVNISEQGDRTDLSTEEQPPPTVPDHVDAKPKYNSLLHRKLREKNIAVRRHIVDTIHQTYTIAARDLHNITVQIQKTQIGFQDMTSHMQKATNSLFTLEDKVDIVQSCNLLPMIKLPENTQAAAST